MCSALKERDQARKFLTNLFEIAPLGTQTVAEDTNRSRFEQDVEISKKLQKMLQCKWKLLLTE